MMVRQESPFASCSLGQAGFVVSVLALGLESRRLVPAGIDPPETRREAPPPRLSRSPSRHGFAR